MNIQEGNKLIAEFMGYELVTPEMRRNPETWSHSYWENPEFKGSSKRVLCEENGLIYHSSWNWLMPALEKFDSMSPETFTPKQWDMYVRYCDMINARLSLYARAKCFEILVEGIKWYNNETQKPT